MTNVNGEDKPERWFGYYECQLGSDAVSLSDLFETTSMGYISTGGRPSIAWIAYIRFVRRALVLT